MLFVIFQLIILWFATLFAGRLLDTKPWLQALVFLAGMTLMTFQISSILFGNALIDYKYYLHFNFSVIANSTGFFVKEGLVAIITSLILLVLLFILSKKWGPLKKLSKKWTATALLGCLSLMSISGGVVSNFYEIVNLHFAQKKQFKAALDDLGIKEYTSSDNLKATSGKNIVVLILESLEANFLREHFKHATPYLRKMSREMNHYDMVEAEGSNYTIGAVYTYLTGFPMFFKNHGNDVFTRAESLKATGISQVLRKAGYIQLYMLGNPDFAGTRKMLELMDIDIKCEDDYGPKFNLDYWGLHDKDLFELSHNEIRKLKEQGKPFAMFMSTISTHQPDGIIDQRVINDFPAQPSHIELMIRSLDHQIEELMKLLASEDLLENTAVYILPDHLLMGRTAPVLSQFEEPRELFLLSNVGASTYDTSESIFQIDVPKIILEGAEVRHNMKFLTDFITGDKADFIEDNKSKLVQLNEATLVAKEKEVKPKETRSFPEIVAKENLIHIRSESWSYENNLARSYISLGTDTVFEAKTGTNLLYKIGDKFQLENYDTQQNNRVVDSLVTRMKTLDNQGAFFITFIHRSGGDRFSARKDDIQKMGFHTLSTLTGGKAYLAISSNGFTSEKTKIKLIEHDIHSAHLFSSRSQEDILSDSNEHDRIIAHAGGIYKNTKYTNSLEALNESYNKGFRHFELDFIETKDGKWVACHDWPQWKSKTGYPGEIPPDLSTFRDQRAAVKYTPMDMDMVNKWFAQHKDAFLITDKINDPIKMEKMFHDPARLKMELFSIKAMEDALTTKMAEAILSENAWDKIGRPTAKTLKQKGITSLAVSIKTILKNKPKFKKLTADGIKIYAYHINNLPFVDEAYMMRKGLDFCHGFYADTWPN